MIAWFRRRRHARREHLENTIRRALQARPGISALTVADQVGVSAPRAHVALVRLENLGQVRSEWEPGYHYPPQRLYYITTLGAAIVSATGRAQSCRDVAQEEA